MKIHNVDQRSPEWFSLRLGRMTASNAATIATNGKGLETYIWNVVAEKYSNHQDQSYVSPDMTRGIELEEQARETYEIEHEQVKTVGFIELNEYVGCSPDGLVGKQGGVEIKCPNDTNYFRLLVGGEKEIPIGYVWQCQMCMLVSKRKWWDLVFYNVNFDQNMTVFRIKRDEEKIAKLEIGLLKGEALIKQLSDEYESRSNNPI